MGPHKQTNSYRSRTIPDVRSVVAYQVAAFGGEMLA